MAIVIAMIILFTWQILFPVEQPIYQQENGQEILLDDPSIPEVSNIIPVKVVSCESEKIIIDNDRLEGSIDLCGAQINEIYLKKSEEETYYKIGVFDYAHQTDMLAINKKKVTDNTFNSKYLGDLTQIYDIMTQAVLLRCFDFFICFSFIVDDPSIWSVLS